MQDVEIAERIFGPDIAALKGKSVRQNPNQVLDDWIEIPEELREIYYDLVLCVDLMFVNGIPFLTAIDRTIRYRSVVPLENRTKEQLYKALDVVLRMYNEAGYPIRETLCRQRVSTFVRNGRRRFRCNYELHKRWRPRT